MSPLTKRPLLLVLLTFLTLLATLTHAAPVAALKRSDDDQSQAPKFDTPKEYFAEFEKERKRLESSEIQNLPIDEKRGMYTRIFLQIEAVTKMVEEGDYEEKEEKEVEKWNEWKEEMRRKSSEDYRERVKDEKADEARQKDEKKADEAIDDSRDPDEE